jgi:hypothetical protein
MVIASSGIPATLGHRMASIIGANRWRQILCTVLLCTIVLVALHSHSFIDPFDKQPISGRHHCLLCIAAHLPSAMSHVATAPLQPAATPVAQSTTDAEVTREPRIAFSLYMRPPPAL